MSATVLRWLVVFGLLAVSFMPAYCIVDLERCTFETGTCGWKANGTYQHDWTVAISSGVNLLKIDHTFQTAGKGQYMSTVGPTSDSRASLLESVVIYPSDDICGIKFTYARDANGKLQVEVDPGGSLISLPSTSFVWTTQVVSTQIKQPSKIVFLMEFSQLYGGKAALDDVQFLSCKQCTFEKDLCSWSSPVEDPAKQVPWTRINGMALSSGPLPSIDYTIRSSKGYYIYIGGTSSNGKHAQLYSKPISYDDDVCGLRLSFVIFGAGVHSLTLKAIDEGNNTITDSNITLHSGHTNSNWYSAVVTFTGLFENGNKIVRFVFTGALDTNSAGSVSLDDIDYHSCLSTDKCLFSDGTCFWNFGPILASRNETLTWNLVPNYGSAIHGKLVADFSSASIPPDQSTVSLKSPILHKEQGICSLRVTYEMEDTLVSSLLKVDVVSLDGTIQPFDVPAANNRGKPTHKEIAITKFPVLVNIYAKRDKVEMGSITLHELQYIPCSYSSFESTIVSPWQRSTFFPVQWNTSRPCISSQECPTQDHTFGLKQEGRFILAESRTVAANKTAAGFKWTDMSMPGRCGVRLWYYVAYGSVKVSVTEPGGRTDKAEATWWTTKIWDYSELAFTQAIQTFKVDFASMKKSGFSLALDDIQLTPCRQFVICTFERNLCDWTPITDPYGSVNANWIRWSGLPPGGDGLSTLDHTRNSSTGHYVYMAVDTEMDGDKTAVLAGVPLGRNSRPCGVEFWYRILRNESENAIAWLTVEQIFDTDFGKAVLWNESDSTSDKWKQVTVQLKQTNHQTVRIEFRGFTATAATFNLDDVAYTDKDCANLTYPTTASMPSSASVTTFATTGVSEEASTPATATSKSTTAPTTATSKDTTAATTDISRNTTTTTSAISMETTTAAIAISMKTTTAAIAMETTTATTVISEDTTTIQGINAVTPTSSKDLATSKVSSGYATSPTISGPTPQKSVGKSTAVIIGSAAGGSLALLMLVVVLIVVLRRRSKKSSIGEIATTKNPVYSEVNSGKIPPNSEEEYMKQNSLYRNPLIEGETSFSSGVREPVYASADVKSIYRPPSRFSTNAIYEAASDKSNKRESHNVIYEGTEAFQ